MEDLVGPVDAGQAGMDAPTGPEPMMSTESPIPTCPPLLGVQTG